MRPFRPCLLACIGACAIGLGPAASAPLVLDCVAEPAQKVKLGSPVTGLLREVLVRRGDAVTAGQPLVRIESSVEEATVALARAQAQATETIEAQRTRAALAKSRLERAIPLARGQVVTQDRLEQLQADADIAERDLNTETLKKTLADLELARTMAAVDLRTIRSPLTGYVLERTLSPGEFVPQEGSILSLVQLDPLHVEAYAPVSLWGRIRTGMAGQVELAATPGRKTAPVTVVDPVFDAASGTFGLRLELPNPESRMPGGQRCRVTFDLDTVEATGSTPEARP